jgi:CHAT domain-containing protein
MKEGKSKSEALASARTEIRGKGFDHPFFWAGFILVGETN